MTFQMPVQRVRTAMLCIAASLSVGCVSTRGSSAKTSLEYREQGCSLAQIDTLVSLDERKKGIIRQGPFALKQRALLEASRRETLNACNATSPRALANKNTGMGLEVDCASSGEGATHDISTLIHLSIQRAESARQTNLADDLRRLQAHYGLK